MPTRWVFGGRLADSSWPVNANIRPVSGSPGGSVFRDKQKKTDSVDIHKERRVLVQPQQRWVSGSTGCLRAGAGRRRWGAGARARRGGPEPNLLALGLLRVFIGDHHLQLPPSHRGLLVLPILLLHLHLPDHEVLLILRSGHRAWMFMRAWAPAHRSRTRGALDAEGGSTVWLQKR